jgi:hypothetical protein
VALSSEEPYQNGLPWTQVGAGWGGGGGWYVHEGSIYIQGVLESFADVTKPAGVLLLSGIPADLRPSEALEFTVPMLVADPATPGLDLPTTATLIVDGDTVSLSALPPWINEVPSYQYDQWINGDHFYQVFTTPFAYGLTLSTLTWPLNVRTLKAPAPPWEDLSPYLGDAFENIDGQIRLWKSRVDIKGSVRALRNIANSIAIDNGSELPYEAITPLLVDLPTDMAPDGGVTVIQHTDFPVYCEFASSVGGQNLYNNEGFDKSAGTSTSIMLFPYNDVRMLGMLYNPSWPDAMPVANPMDDWVPDLAGLFDPNTAWPGGAFWSPCAEVSPFAGGGLDNPTYYWHYSADQGGGLPMESSIGGLTTHPGAIVNDGWGGSPYGPGGKRIQSQPTWEWNNNISVPANSSGNVKLQSLDISEAVNAFDPQPDYVALCIAIGGSSSGGIGAVSITSVGLEGPPDCVLADNQGRILPFDSLDNPGGAIGALSNGPQFIVAWVSPPNFSAVYGDDPNNPASKFLWEWGSLPTVFTPYANWSSGTPLFSSQWAQVNFDIWVIPFWKTRRNWILKDDILTLDGAGWQSPWQPPNLPTTIYAGPRDVALAMRERL